MPARIAPFRAWIRGRSGDTSRLGALNSGVKVVAQSYTADVSVMLYRDRNGVDRYTVELCEHAHGNRHGVTVATLVDGARLDTLPDGRIWTRQRHDPR